MLLLTAAWQLHNMTQLCNQWMLKYFLEILSTLYWCQTKISGGETMGNLCIIFPHLSHWHPLLTYIFILCFMSSSSSMKSGIVLRYNTRSTTRSTQPCIPPRSLNRVPASAGVRAWVSRLPGGRQHCVIPCGMWVPVAVTRVVNCSAPFSLPFTFT